jgi:hypothetical protein
MKIQLMSMIWMQKRETKTPKSMQKIIISVARHPRVAAKIPLQSKCDVCPYLSIFIWPIWGIRKSSLLLVEDGIGVAT